MIFGIIVLCVVIGIVLCGLVTPCVSLICSVGFRYQYANGVNKKQDPAGDTVNYIVGEHREAGRIPGSPKNSLC